MLVSGPTISISPSSATLTSAAPTASLSAIGSAGTLLWSTGQTSPVISVSASGTYSVTLTSPSGCTASTSVPIAGADLTLTLTLPQANFAGPGSVGNFLVDVFEVGGLPTSAGNVTITITAPLAIPSPSPIPCRASLFRGEQKHPFRSIMPSGQ
ncbi:hypothetical protein GO730_37400 [Spirosoma sp. HMF3257]|uniref:Ig-like domain-containing protein n=1 Tax=Spirosoma telluris TaxID=2183553 RepID=A0A327NKL1_9BACT|nr:hypothetical protein [Spirosoma telluris]RAI73068.1 hypothetical protein HMF3257_37325 [Spirosoma telluris]